MGRRVHLVNVPGDCRAAGAEVGAVGGSIRIDDRLGNLVFFRRSGVVTEIPRHDVGVARLLQVKEGPHELRPTIVREVLEPAARPPSQPG